MNRIVVKKGLNIPIIGAPSGPIQGISPSKEIGFNFDPFEDIKLRLLVKPGDEVLVGQPLAEDKEVTGRMFVSPAAGRIMDIRRGEKRRLRAIIIERAFQEEQLKFEIQDLHQLSREELLRLLLQAGFFAHIRMRPFNRLANPLHLPRSIFVKAIETAPFVPSPELQIQGYENEFAMGLDALKKLTTGPVHLVFSATSTSKAFLDAKNVEKHMVSGPHPAGCASVHIHNIDPIKKSDDVIWTVTAQDVLFIGNFLLRRKFMTEQVIAIAGPGVLAEKRHYVRARLGHSVGDCVGSRLSPGLQRIIGGNVLTGEKLEMQDFLAPSHTCLTVIPESQDREFLHFFRLGKDKYSATGAYVSGHTKDPTKLYPFTTNQHGEERPFIDGSIYDKVMPMRILTMQLVKAVLAEDFELAEKLGLLEVDSEDFALAEFICPSKVEMVDIIKQGLKNYAKEILG